MGRPCNDLSGKRFGDLVVVGRMKNDIRRAGKQPRWECVCDCGKTTIVWSSSLKSGDTQSCGCKKGNIKHSGRRTRLYSIWTNMRTRTTNRKATRYENYGGRGIRICQEWLNSFETFRDWSLANGYSDDLSIDRVNNDGNYEPSNCRWADVETQINNTTVAKRLCLDGKTQTLNAWAREKGISATTLCRRLKSGMALETALLPNI